MSSTQKGSAESFSWVTEYILSLLTKLALWDLWARTVSQHRKEGEKIIGEDQPRDASPPWPAAGHWRDKYPEPEVFSAISASKAKKPKPFSKWDWVFPASLSIHRIIFPSPVWCTPYFWAATCSPCHWFPISPLQMPSVFAPWLIIKLLNQLLHPRVCKSKHNLQLPLLKCK